MIMREIEIIEGEVFKDYRGIISSINSFNFDGVKRTYIIHHPDISIVRGWNGHKQERKWFYCLKGRFSVALVKIDDWENPSPSLNPKIYHLTEDKSQLLCVPEGYANCMKAFSKDATMLVLSDKSLEEAANDNWKYASNLWVDWTKI